MTLIPCDCACKHQNDGYCRLETPSVATNSTETGCLYFVDAKTPAADGLETREEKQEKSKDFF